MKLEQKYLILIRVKLLAKKLKKKISDARKGQPKPEGSPSQAIEVTDIQNDTTTSYNSMSEAARALNIYQTAIVKYLLVIKKKPYKGQYTFQKISY